MDTIDPLLATTDRCLMTSTATPALNSELCINPLLISETPCQQWGCKARPEISDYDVALAT